MHLVIASSSTLMPTRLILVRHGLSTYNLEGRFQGCCNEPQLTPQGVRQASLAADTLCKLPIHRIISSPLSRARETAEIIGTGTGFYSNIATDALLREVDIPPWQGLRFDDIRDGQPELYAGYMERPQEFSLQISEHDRFPVVELYRQAAHFLHDKIGHVSETILIVGHGGSIRALINTALGGCVNNHHVFQQSHCGINILEKDSQGRFQLVLMNETTHLGEKMPKIKSHKQGLRAILLCDEGESGASSLFSNCSVSAPDTIWIEDDYHNTAFTKIENMNGRVKRFRAAAAWSEPGIGKSVQHLRASMDRLSTIVVIASRNTLFNLAKSVFCMPQFFLEHIAMTSKIRIVVHDSINHTGPIIQAVRAR